MVLDYKIIGERIRKSRAEKNLTQEILAEKLNVSVTYISRIECGTTHLNLSRLSEICSILNIDEGTILNGTSTDAKSYLYNEFTELLKDCPKETRKLIYEIAKLVIQQQKRKLKNYNI